MAKKKTQAPAKTGRPTDYSDALAARICQLVADGSNLNKICKMARMPTRDTVYRWLRERKPFSDNYVQAREERADTRFDQVDNVIADMRANRIDHNKARVEIDAIKWQTGRENPKRYGDKLDLSVTKGHEDDLDQLK